MIVSIKRIGITGANGNIGRTLTEALKLDYTLSLFDRHAIKSEMFDTQIIDFSDASLLTGAFNGLDALIHLAGDPSPSASESSTTKNNFEATSYVFEEAKKAGVKKIVFASSNFYHESDIGAMMQGQRTQLITLSSPATPQSMYGESKLFGEQLGLHLSHFGISFTTLRIGWTVPQDSPLPYDSPYMRAMFCSKRDLIEAFRCALESTTPFQRGFAISDNDSKLFDLSETKGELGFKPRDNSANY